MNFENDISLFKKSNNSGLSNPYELLPQVDIYQKSELINEGTGAMRAYGELMFGLKKGDDELKDQSYALWGVSQQSLSRTMLPLGNLRKSQIREKALEMGFHDL